jgi:hypothetical protein
MRLNNFVELKDFGDNRFEGAVGQFVDDKLFCPTLTFRIRVDFKQLISAIRRPICTCDLPGRGRI